MLEVNRAEIVAEVQSIFDRYEAALLANDVPVLEELFWHSPRTVRYGVGEDLYGWQAISDFRRARRNGPFARRLENTVITTFGTDFATASTEYWRDGHDRVGREMKSLVRTQDGWRIVAAHVSLIGETI